MSELELENVRVNPYLSLEVDKSPAVNFAMQQNHVPVIRRLVIHNNSDTAFHDVSLAVQAEPPFLYPYEKKLALLPERTAIDAGLIDIQMQPIWLAGLTERLAGILVLTLTASTGEILHAERFGIDVLAFNEWGGSSVLPEMLAAFVTPNIPVLDPILRRVSERIGQWTGKPALDGYQSLDPNRVRRQAAAVYTILQEQQVVYCMPPASFEQLGQRIRLADSVLEQKLGTCLDLSLLYASCLEAAGLNALLVLFKGHACAGVWLQDVCFPEMLQDDVALLAKKSADGIQELLLVETTALVAGEAVPFETAERMALQRLQREDDFICLVDIRRARASGIRPLPQRSLTADGTIRLMQPSGFPPFDAAGESGDAPAPADLAFQPRLQPVDSLPITRQQQWERKLLDLSLRNTLLNFRLTKSTVRLFARQLEHLENLLSDGADFQVLERPADWQNELRDPRSFENQYKLDPYEELLAFEFKQKRLRTPFEAAELQAAMTSLYRSARSSLEENGANTLYLALGFLRWYETEVSQQPRYAPLILIPVDLVRRTVAKGFIIRSRDEEPQINITLLELLRQDHGLTIGGLDPLPHDDKGVDVKAVLNIFRQAVMQKPRWTVVDEAFLGIFSFTRFIMWNDIRNRAADLTKNKTVASLIAGRLIWQPDALLADGTDLDELYNPDRTFLPISADASQLAAIYAAGEGKSFVLHGPPGTGKSQTITNLIANALARGKTVLFVAEKMAALDVVQRRLDAIGIGPFCLELHSNKSRKKDVLDQLRQTTEIGYSAPPEGFAHQADQLHSLRSDLQAYVRQLYTLYPFGLNLFEAISRIGELSDAPTAVSLDAACFANLTRDQADSWFALAGDLQAAMRSCGHPFAHPLSGIGLDRWSQSNRSLAAAQLPGYLETLQETSLFECRLDWPQPPSGAGLQRPVEKGGPDRLYRLANLRRTFVARLLDLPELPIGLLSAGGLLETADRLQIICSRGQVMTESHTALLACFLPGVFEESGQVLLSAWQESSVRWLLPRLSSQHAILNRLKRHVKPGVKLRTDQMESWLKHLSQYQEAKMQVNEQLPYFAGQLTGFWKELETNWPAGLRYAAQLPGLDATIKELAGESTAASVAEAAVPAESSAPAATASVAQAAGASLSTTIIPLLATTAGRQRLADYGQAGLRLDALQQQLADTLNIRFDRIDLDSAVMAADAAIPDQTEQRSDGLNTREAAAQSDWYDRMQIMARNWLEHLDGLREWCQWRSVRAQAVAAGMDSLIEAIEQGAVDIDETPDAFSRAYYQTAAAWIIEQDPVLNSFSGELFEEKIRRFRQMHEQFELMTRQEIHARLADRIPSFDIHAAGSSELGILQRAIRSNGRALSIRRLFEMIPNLLPRLAPCMLMSPISVAQYLDPGQTLFDLVVFDEASQMPTSEAVGAIARGHDVVVVGDPRQLPPTSFFTIDQTNEENFDTEDLESVLDDCLALSMPQMHLLWHYRSRHESLITFSNRQYYESKLLTFPSPNDLVSKVRLVPVAGEYDRGKTKQNRIEAQAVVTEIVRRLEDPQLSRRSIGVVTFNAIQQNLIDDLLSEVFLTRPDLEEKANQGLEPVFIKNLENVQGDERDIILFSIGYGPDKSGRVSLNFGPLNREGGWRRLNVAVSRARYEMIVFSTIQPEQLDVSRTAAAGVAGLKAFLEYARRGMQGLPVNADHLVVQTQSGLPAAQAQAGRSTAAPAQAGQSVYSDRRGLAAQVAAALEENGYPTQLQVGSSGYRIDLGVIHPDRPGEYILGILCNGPTYRDARTTRDREILQATILRQLGWQLHQIWAVDWWANPAREIRRLLRHLEEIRAQRPAETLDGAGAVSTTSAASATCAVSTTSTTSATNTASAPFASVVSELPRPSRQEQAQTSSRQTGWPGGKPYQRAVLPMTPLSIDDFLLVKQSRLVIGKLQDAVRIESPIECNLAYRRVLQSCGINRISPRVRQWLDQLVDRSGIRLVRDGERIFLWRSDQDPQQPVDWRTAADEQGRRQAEELPPEEVASLAREILQQQIGLPRADLVRVCAKSLGYAQLGSTLEQTIRSGIDLAIQMSWIRQGNNGHDNLTSVL